MVKKSQIALGLAAIVLFALVGFGAAHAQIYASGTASGTVSTGSTTGTAGTSTTVPGVPNTGAGGEASMNILLLGSSALIMAFGAAYVLRKSTH